MQENNKKYLLIIDGHALVHRSFHGIRRPMITRSSGQEVRGAYGFLNTLIKTIREWEPTHIALTFDTPKPTFRHEQYSEYKSNRTKSEPELIQQFPIVKEIADAFDISVFELPGYEADDLIGTISLNAEQNEINTYILTGDSDTLQLVSNNTKVIMHTGSQNQKLYDEIAVIERYDGIKPNQQIDIKGLQGDTSDNIPGVPGIGAKTAIKLIKDYSSIENLYDNINDVTPERIRILLENHKTEAMQSKYLATIVRTVPLKIDFNKLKIGELDLSKVGTVLKKYEFFSLYDRAEKLFSKPDQNIKNKPTSDINIQPILNTKYEVINDLKELQALETTLLKTTAFSFDTETTSLIPTTAKLVGISITEQTGTGFYIPLGHEQGRQISLVDALPHLQNIFQSKNVKKYAHNANYDLTVLKNHAIEVNCFNFDTMIAAQILGYNAIGLKQLSFDLLNEPMSPINELIGSGKKQITFDQVPIEDAYQYACRDSDMTYRLQSILEHEIREKKMSYLFFDIEMPLTPILVDMQLEGISINPYKLNEMSVFIQEKLAILENNIYEAAAQSFNINSPQQLGAILFEKLIPINLLKENNLPLPSKTKTGFSTNSNYLEDIRDSHFVIDLVLEYRQLAKLKSTYLDSLPKLINNKTGRIHTKYNQVGSSTGRFSSSDPNLQNIPVRTELGNEVRKAFISKNECLLLSADYSQIELRVLAHFSEDPNLISAFNNDHDIHSATASLVYKVPQDNVDPSMRRIAKIMNFGVIYGLSAHGMTRQTNLNYQESNSFIHEYFEKYPKINDYINSTKQSALNNGYVETLSGRRRYIPEISHSNFQVRNAAERMAINMPIQGTAADIIKIAMIKIQSQIHANNLNSKMLLQVHDELIFECPEGEISEIRNILDKLMTNSLELLVPLKIEYKIGKEWGNMEKPLLE